MYFFNFEKFLFKFIEQYIVSLDIDPFNKSQPDSIENQDDDLNEKKDKKYSSLTSNSSLSSSSDINEKSSNKQSSNNCMNIIKNLNRR